MDSKLQQAIVAARTGHQDVAQVLLTDLLQENPKESEAWFLLAHLVDSTDRQERYLEYTLLLNPDHAVARDHLERLRNPGVPAPVLKQNSNPGIPSSEQKTPAPTVDSVFSPIPPARTGSSVIVTEGTSTSTSSTGNPQVVVEQNSSRIDKAWQATAGSPKRATPTAVPLAQPVAAPLPTRPKAAAETTTMRKTEKETERPPNKWLLATLVVLVAIACFVLSFLAYTFFMQ